MKLFEKPFKLDLSGFTSKDYRKNFKTHMDPGSTLFGGVEEANSLGMRRDGTKGELFGDKGLAIDWFGSPITAGTDAQPYARGAAMLYGLWAGAGAMGAGGAGGASSTGGTAGGAAGTSGTTGTSGGGAVTGSSTPGWMQYARMGANMARNQNQRQQDPRAQRVSTGSIEMPGSSPSAPAEFFDPNPQQPTAPRGYYDLMLGLADLGPRERAIKSQLELAEELRGTPMPEGRGFGRTFTAAHPLEFANTAVRQGLGYQQRFKGMDSQKALAEEIRRRIELERAKQRRDTPASGMTVPSTLEA